LETLKYAKLFMLLSFSAATLIANGQESAIRKSVTAVLFDTDLRGRFESEQRDNEWAAEMEDSVRTAVTQLETQELQLEEIHCRATVCRSVLGHSSTIEDINDDARREILRRIGDALRQRSKLRADWMPGQLHSMPMLRRMFFLFTTPLCRTSKMAVILQFFRPTKVQNQWRVLHLVDEIAPPNNCWRC
jgi:hypothetical protein